MTEDLRPLAGLRVVVVACDANGNVDVEALRAKGLSEFRNLHGRATSPLAE